RLFFSDLSLHHRDLHSFPTRRSSDLGGRARLRVDGQPPLPGAAVALRRPRLSARRHPPAPPARARAPRGAVPLGHEDQPPELRRDRKSTRLNSSHGSISYAVFCLKKT